MTTPTLDPIKSRQQQTWSSGDYGRIAWLTVPLADVLCDAVDLQPGSTVPRRRLRHRSTWQSPRAPLLPRDGRTSVPELLDVARQRAAAEGLSIEFEPGDAESLPTPTIRSTTSVGHRVMFAANQEQAASELVRVCRPGHDRRRELDTHGLRRRDARDGRPSPSAAGGRTTAHRVGNRGPRARALRRPRVGVRCTTATVTERFPTAEFFADFFIEHYGPTLKASEALDGDARATRVSQRPRRAGRPLEPLDRRRGGLRLGVPGDRGDEGMTTPMIEEAG